MAASSSSSSSSSSLAPAHTLHNDTRHDHSLMVRAHPPHQQPSFVFVCLGVGGGPLESDCSCYMVKPADQHWRDGSYVLEGGSWLGALSTVCAGIDDFTSFHDFDFTYADSSLRAGEIGSSTKAFLLSHAHLDHCLGLVLGSASLPGKRQVYGLKSSLDNLMGMFDGKLWPKLASFKEDAPFIVYHLKPIEPLRTLHLDDSLAVLPFALSHGLNQSTIPAPPTPTASLPSSAGIFTGKRFSLPLNNSLTPAAEGRVTDSRISTSGEKPSFSSPFAPDRLPTVETSGSSSGHSSPFVPSTASAASGFPGSEQESSATSETTSLSSTLSPTNRARSLRSHTKSAERDLDPLGSTLSPSSSSTSPTSSSGIIPPALKKPTPSGAVFGRSAVRRPQTASAADDPNNGLASAASAPAAQPRFRRQGAPSRVSLERESATLDSTAFFLTHKKTGVDVLFLGDVEPDSVARSPRNSRVWHHAASRFNKGCLHSVFLECSYPAAQPTEFLWGHLSTKYLYDELISLARFVKADKIASAESAAVAAAGSSPPGPRTRQGSIKGGQGRPQRGESHLQPMQSDFDFSSVSMTDSRRSSQGSQGAPAFEQRFPHHQMSSSSSPHVAALLRGGFHEASAEELAELRGSLSGLTIVLIHVKTAFFPSFADAAAASSSSSGEAAPRVLDARTMQQRILEELEEMNEEKGLGCRFVMSRQGMRIET